MLGLGRSVFAASVLMSLASLLGQDPVAPLQPQEYPTPPATQLEGFQSPIGGVFAIAHENLGTVQGVRVEAVELRDEHGKAIRGIIFYLGDKRSYVDADEIPGLIQACDKLLEVNSNPTSLKSYEARYMTRGGLQLAATVTERQGTTFQVKVGRFETADAGAGAVAMQQLRTLISTAADKLDALAQ